ncbi:MAG: sigma 54-interacting transcriptional regulator, partial [Sorangiineae bacterium]|nr:sigma 54-interacting transcriptional regulator [Sorangiineae bacterium]
AEAVIDVRTLSAAAYDAIARARAAGDDRCRAYAHLALADVAAADDPEGVEHARRAVALIDARDREDELWTGARLVARGAEAELDLARLDELGRGSDLAVDARLAWWEARARRALRRSPPERPDALLSELAGLAAARAPCTARGPALAAGAELAALAGDGELARRFAEGAAEAARELLARVPPEVASAARALPWVAAASRASEPVQLSSAQLGDIEALVRALARRDRLRPLLDRIVDALVLWTGVERGLLLLRAPGERLVPRAARNLARGDLAGAQLELSQSLAKRALALGEPVIAVDAAGELPEVHRSVHALRLRSVLAVPLIARGEALGVVYLDDRARRGAFGPRELAWVKLVGALAAVAIADARDQLLLARAARRARRAEARAALALARRETELDVAERELARARDARDTRFEYGAIIGRSEPLRAMLRVVDRVSVSEVPVLVIGESGSGKELVARAIHDNGPRAGRPFVSENCGALPESLLDSALFGHVRGAFTGASTPRAGLFETAHQGTLFLDELGEMSPALQAKLLRVLEDGVVHPVGSERPRRVDVRVIGATHRDLAEMAERGAFRRDLLYRLDVISIRIPPLRERPGDVALLVRHFVAKYAAGRRVRVATAALDLLAASPWPGNVRQLENELRRALVLADDEIRPEHLSPEVSGLGASGARARGLELRPHIDALEVRLVSEALARSAGNQTRAAELLGVSRFGLQKMMRRLGL